MAERSTDVGAAARDVERSLARIAARDGALHAWAFVDPQNAGAQAVRIDALAQPLPLRGIAFGVKDLIDVAGMPTTWGSRIYAGNVAVRDAACVALARAAGAVILGKTVTTEFASAAPSVTRNPWNPARSPGGSSSGSAAAVADGHVRIAFGTQTMGSVIRPAAYCGVVGFKPTYGLFSLEGIRSLAPSFDTLGWIARTVEDAALAWTALLDRPPLALGGALPVLGLARTSAWPKADPPMRELVERVAAETSAFEVEVGFDDFDDVFFDIAIYEMRGALATERLQHQDALNAPQREIVSRSGYDDTRFAAAQARVRRFDVDAAFGRADLLLMLPASGEAPNPDHTGDPVFNRFASLLGLPAVTIPVARGPHGMPLGIQLVGRPHADELVLRAAQALAARYPFSYADLDAISAPAG